MTNKEAAEIMKAIIFMLKNDDYTDEVEEAIHMAINALTAQEQLANHSPELDSDSGELIIRQVAIDALAENMPQTYTPDGSHPADEGIFMVQEIYADCIQTLKDLTHVQPETAKRIVGKSRDGMTLWYQCDMCNEPVDAQDNFCRGCGRRLTDG